MRATLGYNRSLDGLRALAVGTVIAEHAGFSIGGGYGVTAFFVISGYLITALLLAEREKTGRISFAGFYRRRWARLAPGLLLVIAVTLIWLFAIGVPVTNWLAGAIGALTYSTDFLEVTSAQPHISNYFEWSWSLSIEEQFYLVWPVLIVAILAIGARFGAGRGRQLLVAVSLAVVVVAWVDRWLMVSSHANAQRVGLSFDAHMDAIALGAILAITVTGRAVSPKLRMLASPIGVVAAAVLVAVTCHHSLVKLWLQHDAKAYGLVSVLCALVVTALVLAPAGLLARGLSWAPLVHLGKLSYGLYLWNMVLRDAFQYYFVQKPAHDIWWRAVIWLAVLVGVAELSYRFVETPLRRRWAHREHPAPADEAAQISRERTRGRAETASPVGPAR